MIVERAPGSWLVDGMVDALDLKDLLGTRELPGESEGVYHTVGGMMMIRMGRVPRPADAFEWGGYRFEVVDMDGARVDKVLITRLPESETEKGKSDDG